MTCINWVRVRKGARPAGPRLEIEQLRTIAACVAGELVDFSLFLRFVLLLFDQGSPNRPKFNEERAGLGFFFFPLSEKSGNRVSNCVTLGVVSGAVEAAATTEPA